MSDTLILGILNAVVLVSVAWIGRRINTLEKNTNSIKDALVKVTGESEHAKGVIQGKAQEKAKNINPRTDDVI